MGDVRLDINIPEETSRRDRRWMFALGGGALAVSVIAGALLNPFAADGRPALASVRGQTFWSSGDSTSYYMSIALTNRLVESGAVPLQEEPEYVNSSGLVSRDFFDWPSELESVAKQDPDIVFFMIGANDAREGLDLDAYRADVAAIMDTLEDDDRRVIWIGQPTMEDPVRAELVCSINDIFRSEAAKRPWVHYVDVWDATSAGGDYTQFVEIDGESTKVREDDGLHFTLAGGALLADTVIEAAFSE
jgi:uncharacterized protein